MVAITANSSPSLKDCHFQDPQKMSLYVGVLESQNNFCQNFPKNSHEPHFYVQLTIFCPPAQIDFCDRNAREPTELSAKMAIRWE